MVMGTLKLSELRPAESIADLGSRRNRSMHSGTGGQDLSAVDPDRDGVLEVA